MNTFRYLILAIITEIIGTSALRASWGFTRWLPGAVVIIAYGAVFFLLSLALKQIPFNTAYAMVRYRNGSNRGSRCNYLP